MAEQKKNDTAKAQKQKLASGKAPRQNESHEFETMSQQQNRYGKGRDKSGSDGSSTDNNFSNH